MKLNINYKQIGARIIQRRKELSISQKELAECVNISNNHLSNIENGKASPSFEIFLTICSELKTTPDFIIFGTVYADINEEIVDKIKHCSDEDKIRISKIIDVFLAK